jgi:hypothetical protein
MNAGICVIALPITTNARDSWGVDEPKPVPDTASFLRSQRLIYRMLNFGHQYVDQGIEYYEAK